MRKSTRLGRLAAVLAGLAAMALGPATAPALKTVARVTTLDPQGNVVATFAAATTAERMKVDPIPDQRLVVANESLKVEARSLVLLRRLS